MLPPPDTFSTAALLVQKANGYLSSASPFHFLLETLISHALKPSCYWHRYRLYHLYVALYNDAARGATLIAA